MSIQPRCTCDFSKPLPGTDCPRHAKLRKWLDEEWLPLQAQARVEAAKDGGWEFCWLVELFHRGDGAPSMGRYHTGLTDLHHQSRSTTRPHEAKRYTKQEAERVAAELNVHMMACEWRAVEHGFAVAHVSGVVASHDACEVHQLAHPCEACAVESQYEQALSEFEQKQRGLPQAHIAAALVAELRAAFARTSGVIASATNKENSDDGSR